MLSLHKRVEVSLSIELHLNVRKLRSERAELVDDFIMLQVGSYHAASLLVASRAPTPGVVSRGIGMEGVTSFLAGLWGTGAGATTLTENVHTIAVTKMGSRRAVEFGACVMIGISLVGKFLVLLLITLVSQYYSWLLANSIFFPYY